jgi:hypothetical protein
VSPQPYTTTRLARRLDAQDNRAKPLSHLLSLLRHMTQRPRYIVLENVKVGLNCVIDISFCFSIMIFLNSVEPSASTQGGRQTDAMLRTFLRTSLLGSGRASWAVRCWAR